METTPLLTLLAFGLDSGDGGADAADVFPYERPLRQFRTPIEQSASAKEKGLGAAPAGHAPSSVAGCASSSE